MKDESRFWRYFHEKLAWGQIFKPGPLSALLKGVALSLDTTRQDMILLREQFTPETADKSLIEGFGASRGIIRTRLDTDESYRKRVINAFVWHKLGGKSAGVKQILAENGFLNAQITPAGGDQWASFRVVQDIPEYGLNRDIMTWLRWLINEYKPARSRLLAFSWTLPLDDRVETTEDWTSRIVTNPVENRPWGFPLHDGTIRYGSGVLHEYDASRLHNGAKHHGLEDFSTHDNAMSHDARERYGSGRLRAHDGAFFHDGTIRHSPRIPLTGVGGHLHNATLDAVDFAVRASIPETFRAVPYHNGSLPHNGQNTRERVDMPALDAVLIQTAPHFSESVKVAEDAVIAPTLRMQDGARRHDGGISHGQRFNHIRDGLNTRNGSVPRHHSGGVTATPLRHDGLAGRSGEVSHRLYGWQSGSFYAPILTYRATDDSCRMSVSGAARDDFSLNDTCVVGVYRYTFHNDKTGHYGLWRHSAREV